MKLIRTSHHERTQSHSSEGDDGGHAQARGEGVR